MKLIDNAETIGIVPVPESNHLLPQVIIIFIQFLAVFPGDHAPDREGKIGRLVRLAVLAGIDPHDRRGVRIHPALVEYLFLPARFADKTAFGIDQVNLTVIA